jgi:type III restriction enzyme
MRVICVGTQSDVSLTWLRDWTNRIRRYRPLNGTETALPRFEKHLLCDEEGKFPELLNTWEQNILLTELHRSDNVAWYRNPDRATPDSLGITYQEDNENKILRPDFLFFARSADGTIVVDIVDPHGHHFTDSLPKLQGPARYAETHGAAYRRIEAVAELNKDQYKLLNLKDEKVRKAVPAAKSAESLYKSPIAQNYVQE